MYKWLLGTVAVVLAGCQNEDARYAPIEGMVYCAEANPVSFNPQVTTSGSTIDLISKQLYNRLLRIDPVTGEFIPELATSWQINKDGTEITFKLREDVQFHTTAYFTPTRLFNADDVVFSFNRLFDVYNPYHFVGEANYPYFQSVGLDQLIRNIRKDSEYQVTFELFNAESSFLANLATDFAAITSREYAMKLMESERMELFDQYPVGTGPFVYREFQRDRFIRYYSHPDYWEHQVNLDQLVFDITPNGTTRIVKLLTKECDVTPHPSATQLDVLRERSDIDVQQQDNLNIGYWAFNTERVPFNDPDVRRALAHAINVDKIMQAVYYGQGVKATSMLPPISWAYQEQNNLPEYNPDKARELLAEAGYENGFEMSIWAMPVSRIYNPNARKMAELMQSDLREVGIKVRIVEYEWNTFLQRVDEHRHDSVLLGWAADTPDPDNFFSPLLSCAATFSGKNPANWCNPEFDFLLTQALATTDQAQRKAFYVKAQQMIAEQLPLLPLAHGKRSQANDANIQGITLSPFGGISLAHASKMP
ncbi:ABC transporter substrate-binding protein [Pseudoalteromonas sp. T1lg10]|uniref:ABC transporter substrate-binding protein n=1 Tax=Pseudoalteromonas sp. T1lg10 TaxID=2077093 RepID=UPI000CF5FB89|nr:ABC transporter substrate-binding protein [Pseudoalteromonas sp. T1lg10]